MIDHAGLTVRSCATSKQFYLATLEPLGYGLVVDQSDAVAFGPPEMPLFWLYSGAQPHSGVHIALTAPDRNSIDRFHAAGLAAGGRDNGAPGLRPEYHEHYDGAFIIDPDGNNVEAVCHAPG
jgi:catechol 2,3-dioxygenase-like lactoylglutathione lyase family enzyme